MDKVPEHDEIRNEMISLAIKAGRRASYDLKHACAFIDDPQWVEFYEHRAQMWLDIFSMDSGIKDYRHSLHNEIHKLEVEVERLQRLLKENGIDDPEHLPF